MRAPKPLFQICEAIESYLMSVTSGSDSRRIVVVGAGIVGLSIALRLQLEGYQITLIDQNDPMTGCSAGNAGYFSEANIFPPATPDLLRQLPKLLFSKDGPLVIKPAYLNRMIPWSMRAVNVLKPAPYAKVMSALSSLIIRSQDSINQLAGATGAAHLITRNGGLHVYRSEAAFKAKLQALPYWEKHGISVKILNGADARALEPALADNVIGGLYFPESGRCSDPKELGLHYFRYLLQNGAQFLQSAFLGVETDLNSILQVVLPGQRLSAAKVVMATGHSTDRLLQRHGFKSALVAERGYHLMMSEPGVSLSRPVVFGEAYFAATPMDKGLRFAGTAEFCRPDAPPNMQRSHMLQQLAKQYIPGLTAAPGQPWMGVRPSLPDGLPAIGKVASQPGLFYAFGHAHNGLTTSAITAQCVSSLIDGREPPIDIKPFDYNRFSHSAN
ncbi:NAD(P)/FAD-dependent oxidoreductase [Pseudomonas sp. EpS/L25]|uniref:NAD(P)/FAD-dependent oxidoreductase n=1 Tax=Pseudomonas sp. EpS/L25 TaxID=1749078 RepID=UPI0009EB4379|nr:FAD-dependent oxidoreductase [Pseudomonas sp. EpS/L25]